jgi:Ca2+-binding EF-hand superfamily protein
MASKRIESMLLSVAVLAVFFFASIAIAQQGGGAQSGGSNPDIIGQWDKDKDGKVSKAEWQRSEKIFKQYDKNNSGYIESDEKPQMPTTDLMDANGDGKVSKDEFVGPADFFKQLDKNNDGFVTDDENTMKSNSSGGAQGAAPGAGK